MKFKLLAGGHADADGFHTPASNPIVQSETDFVARFGAEKFARVADDTPLAKAAAPKPVAPASPQSVNPTAVDLSAMDKTALLEFAEDHEIDLENVNKRKVEEIRKAIADAL